MGSYKLIQDIEAEDHILGPLTLKQFIFFLVFAFCMYFVFLGVSKKMWILLPVFIPPALVTGFFAFPFGKDQPTEVWAMAKIRFLFKPRKRIWDQNGIKHLVTVNAPQKVEKHLTKEMSQGDVQSRLKALANTLDSRGWAVKHAEPNQDLQNGRLLDVETATDYADLVENTTTDMFDEDAGPLANHFDQMLDTQSVSKRQDLEKILQQPDEQSTTDKPSADKQWFDSSSTVQSSAVSKPADPSTSNMHTLQRLDSNQPAPVKKVAPTNPALIELAKNNDLNISTIARQASKQNQEVTIDLQ